MNSTILDTAKAKLSQNGHLSIKIGNNINLIDEIKRIKKEKNAILLAHYYQEDTIQDLADVVGDSLYLAQQAEKATADIIVFAGVHFMAETAKILNPQKKVVLPDLHAGCSLAESCPPDVFKKFVQTHPDHIVVSYINCSAAIKALSDIICTSSNALKVIQTIPENKPILFAPDKNLGKYLSKKSGRQMLLWEGSCIVHETFSIDKILALKKAHPQAKFIAHPESEENLLKIAHFIGSTSKLIDYVKNDAAEEFIVATEVGILHQMAKEAPHKKVIAAPVNEENDTYGCHCSICHFMKMNTLEKLYLCLKYELPEITLSESLRKKAFKPLKRMLEVSTTRSINSVVLN